MTKKINLENLTTERQNPATLKLDQLTTNEACQLMNTEDKKVAEAITPELPHIEAVIEKVIQSFRTGGRLIYMGAGTSGRLGVLDAAECVPTFGVDSSMVIGLIAGGQKAMTVAVEGAEDSIILGAEDLKKIKLSEKDTVVGIAASGRTPYVIGGLRYAQTMKATTVSLSCNLNSEISEEAEHSIEVDCGPEFLTGSTRLKAGTAQKLVLNMISTISMIGIGKVYGNLMVDVQPTNEKLVERSKSIIMNATDSSYEIASRFFEEANREVKVAIVMILTGVDADQARAKLLQANGFIRQTKA